MTGATCCLELRKCAPCMVRWQPTQLQPTLRHHHHRHHRHCRRRQRSLGSCLAWQLGLRPWCPLGLLPETWSPSHTASPCRCSTACASAASTPHPCGPPLRLRCVAAPTLPFFCQKQSAALHVSKRAAGAVMRMKSTRVARKREFRRVDKMKKRILILARGNLAPLPPLS